MNVSEEALMYNQMKKHAKGVHIRAGERPFINGIASGTNNVSDLQWGDANVPLSRSEDRHPLAPEVYLNPLDKNRGMQAMTLG